jgi:hypothetical protein
MFRVAKMLRSPPIMSLSKFQRAAPHDILVAWQDGEIGYREAMALTACENLFELYEACRSSCVAIRRELTPAEMLVVDAALVSFQPTSVSY